MAHHARPQRRQHLVLQVVVVLVQPLLGAARGRHGARVVRRVVVDGDGVHVVHAADEVVNGGRRRQGLHGRRVAGPDELGFEADDDMDLCRVERLQPLCFKDVG